MTKCQKCKNYADYLTIVKTVSKKRYKKYVGKQVCDSCVDEIGANKE